MTRASTASRAPPRGSTPVLAFGLGLLSVGLPSGGLVREPPRSDRNGRRRSAKRRRR